MLRKCVGCGEMKERSELIKITKTNDGKIIINPDTKTFGRSAYLCYNQSCIETALKKSKLHKALKSAINIEKTQLCALLKN